MLRSAARIVRHKGIGVLFSASANLGRAAVARSFLGKRFIRKQVYDYKMWLDTHDPGISRTLILFGERELEHRWLMEQLVRPGMTVFDIGANIGYYVLMEHRLLKGTGRIVALEPSPQNAALLHRNLELNGTTNVTFLPAACSDVVGQRDFFIAAESNLNSFHPDSARVFTNTVRVETTTLPQLAAKFGAPNLLRMDVEGHEVEILNAMMPEVASGRMRPVVIFEVHRRRYSPEHDFEKTLRGLFALGYRVTIVGSSMEEGTERIRALGYRPGRSFRTDFMTRTIFRDIKDEDAVSLICRTGGVRTVVLSAH